jgi:type VI secretion system protein ImpK
MNAAQLSRSTLLNKLRGFYAIMVRLKQEIEQGVEDVPVERVQGELRTYMDDQLAGEGAEEVGYHLTEALKFVMVALADDTFLHLSGPWPGRAAWLSSPLEKQIFGTQTIGGAFFQQIDELLATRDKSKEEVATAFLVALLLGFKGRYRGREEDKLVSYRQRLAYFVTLGQKGSVDESKPIFPDAYANTVKKDPTAMLPDSRRYVRLLVLVLLGYLGAAHLLWHFQTNEVRRVVQELNLIKATTAGTP